MTKEQLDAMEAAARKRLSEFISKSGGQHKRVIAKGFADARLRIIRSWYWRG